MVRTTNKNFLLDHRVKMAEETFDENYYLNLPSFEFDLSEIQIPLDEKRGTNEENRDNEKYTKKPRFAELSQNDQDKIVTNAQAKRTDYSTSWGFTVFKDWCDERGKNLKLETLEEREIDALLRQFYAEVRNKDGQDYSRNSLISLRYAIERYLNMPPISKGIKISNNPQFASSNQMLDAKLKMLKKEGKENAQHKPPIEQEDIQKIKTSTVILPDHPVSLLRNVWFHSTLYWCRRGREGQRSLKKSSFSFEVDAAGRKFVTMTHEEATKNHPGGTADIQSFEKFGRMYETDSPTDGYKCLKKYLSKLHPANESLFQYPKRNFKPDDLVWYENRPLGVNKLSEMMKQISLAAKLSKIYTNHSVRATAITLWSEARMSNRQIMAISGHRNEASLRSYNSRPSDNDLRLASDVLSSALVNTNSSSPGQSVATSSQSQFNKKPPSNEELFGNLFTSCTIGKVEVNIQK